MQLFVGRLGSKRGSTGVVLELFPAAFGKCGKLRAERRCGKLLGVLANECRLKTAGSGLVFRYRPHQAFRCLLHEKKARFPRDDRLPGATLAKCDYWRAASLRFGGRNA